jgi:Na+/melibiose symporter-like transporter
LSIDGVLLHLGGFVALLFAGVFLGADATALEFSLVFFFSAIAATVSLFCIQRIPEAATHETLSRSGQAVPWKEIIFYPPFFKLTLFNLLFTAVAGSFGVFTVAYMRGKVGLDEGTVLILASLGFVAAICTYPLVRRILEVSGSKRVLRFALVMMAGILAAWGLVACGVISCALQTFAALSFAWGFAAAHFNLANAKLMMATMPEMGRTHFYAFFSVILSLGFGIAPILWGVILDAIGEWNLSLAPNTELNRFSIYFGLLAIISLGAAIYARYLDDKEGLPIDNAYHSILVASNLRRLGRLLHR